MRSWRAFALGAVFALGATSIGLGSSSVVQAQQATTAAVRGEPGTPGVPSLALDPGIHGSWEQDPSMLPDTPVGNDLTTAYWIEGGSSGAAGTNAGSDAPTASGE